MPRRMGDEHCFAVSDEQRRGGVRRIPLDKSLPGTGHPISAIDLDVTNDCPLQCDYCFKGPKAKRYMTFEVAQRAVDWLIAASLGVRDLKVYLMGGEPLMAFDLIKKIVPYGKRRAGLFGKTMHFSVTTNMVLVTQEVIDFWRRYGMGFHTSIDGVPEAHDRHRHFPNGGRSSHIIEKKVPMILGYQPSAAARATYCADTVHLLIDSASYFASLGYTNMVFAAAQDPPWSEGQLALLESQVAGLADFVIQKMRRGESCSVSPFAPFIGVLTNPDSRRQHVCGAGRGFVLVDSVGDIWPCHRFGGEAKDRQWVMGSMFGDFEDSMQGAFLSFDTKSDLQAECGTCPANVVCPGQCLAEAQEFSGSVYKPTDSYCTITRAFFRESLRILHTLEKEHNELFLSTYCERSGGATRPAMGQKGQAGRVRAGGAVSPYGDAGVAARCGRCSVGFGLLGSGRS